jgi:hypothetical protein
MIATWYANRWFMFALFALFLTRLLFKVARRSRGTLLAFLKDRVAIWWAVGVAVLQLALGLAGVDSDWRNFVALIAGSFVWFFIVGTLAHYVNVKRHLY